MKLKFLFLAVLPALTLGSCNAWKNTIALKGIKKDFKSILIGDTVNIPCNILKSGEKINGYFFSNLSEASTYDCIIKGIVSDKKKPSRYYLLTVQPIDICNYNEIIMSREKIIVINQPFEYDVRYFKIFLKGGATK